MISRPTRAAIFRPHDRRGRLRRLAETDERASGGLSGTDRITAAMDRHPRGSALSLGLVGAIIAWIWAGPIAAAIAGVYLCLAASIVIARRRDNAEKSAAGRAADGLVALAAELRAGADPNAATAMRLTTIRASGAAGLRMGERISTAVRVAEITGAGLADLLERLEEDVRATARIRELASAQSAGAQTTAYLLAGLPIVGIALGSGIGAHPLHELLHTRLGAICAGIALALQATGLSWANRLARPTRDAT
jgi:tight adherence protein B